MTSPFKSLIPIPEYPSFAKRAGRQYNSTMTAEHFGKVLRAFQKRAPFRSFLVELVSGSKIKVDHPEALVFRNGVAVYLSSTGSPTLFDHDSVAQVTDVTTQRAA